MVNARSVSGWEISPTMLVGISPKFSYYCGHCGKYNSTRISVEAIRRGRPYTCCARCGTVNNLNLRF